MQSAVLKRASGAACLPRPVGVASRRPLIAVQQRSSTSTSAGPQDEIYIGFEKEDGFGSREGRKGRVIRDDPKKYPSRDWIGVGGWAGGEAGLWKLREEAQKDLGKKGTKLVKGPNSPLPPPRAPAGKAAIYVGFNKDELDLRKSGVRGRVIIDDPRKYPGKEDIGPLPGVAGGFAGGERGVKQFATTGELKLRRPGEPGQKQFSPLTLAGVVALAGAVGGVVLNYVTDAGENALPGQVLQQVAFDPVALQQAALDPNTKYLALGGIGLTAGAALIIAINSAIKSVQEKIQENAGRVVVTSAFVLVVLAVGKAILDDF